MKGISRNDKPVLSYTPCGRAFTVCAENAPCTGTYGDKETAVSVTDFRVALLGAAEKLLGRNEDRRTTMEQTVKLQRPNFRLLVVLAAAAMAMPAWGQTTGPTRSSTQSAVAIPDF